jgi:hypothetical protein
MSLEKQWRIVQLLFEKTQAGELDWKPTVEDNAFQVSFRNYTLILREQPSDEAPDTSDYVVSLLNETGDLADTFSDVGLQQEFGGSITPSSMRPYQLMARMFQLARRKATGADKIIDAILEELGDIPF